MKGLIIGLVAFFAWVTIGSLMESSGVEFLTAYMAAGYVIGVIQSVAIFLSD